MAKGGTCSRDLRFAFWLMEGDERWVMMKEERCRMRENRLTHWQQIYRTEEGSRVRDQNEVSYLISKLILYKNSRCKMFWLSYHIVTYTLWKWFSCCVSVWRTAEHIFMGRYKSQMQFVSIVPQCTEGNNSNRMLSYCYPPCFKPICCKSSFLVI